MGGFGLPRPATTLNRSLDWQYTDIFTEAKNTSLLLCATCVKNLDAGKDWLEDSASRERSLFPLVSAVEGHWTQKPVGTDWAEGYLRVSGLIGQSVKGKKGKPASLWFVKSHIEIKTCMAEFARNVILNTQDEVHKRLRDNSVIFLFCFSIVCLPYKCQF